MKKSIAIVSSLISGTGNKTTAQRLCTYLESDYSVHLCETNDYETSESFNCFIKRNNVEVVIGIHLVKSGRLLVGGSTPFIMIAGGTDMNISVKNSEEVNIMTEVVKVASYIVVFTDDMRKRALNVWPLIQDKLLVQPQGVYVSDIKYSFSDLFLESRQVEMKFENMNVFLVIGGIRSVKDPLYLSDVISKWHSVDSSICMIIIGPILDIDYAEKCYQTIAKLNAVYLFPEISIDKVHSLMRQSVALVNSSHSEGMCGAILEAMSVGTPVIARSNEGNLSLISDGETGLIYSTADEFLSKASLLLSDESLRKTLIENGKAYVDQCHSLKKEKETYLTMTRELIG